MKNIRSRTESRPFVARRGRTKNPPGGLLLVATPIGNLEDISQRAVRSLADCDLVAAEDTRLTGMLLAHFGISKPMVSCFDANEAPRARQIVERCLAGEKICLVTSAGHPCISDPGYRIVATAVEAGVPVSVIPGPCAAVSALSISGLPGEEFTFHGFLPRKESERARVLARMARGGTHIVYESPNRLLDTLEELRISLGDPKISVTRELSKVFEETLRGKCSDILRQLDGRQVKGEFTVTLHVDEPESGPLDQETNDKILEMKYRLGLSDKDAASAASLLLDLSKTEIYQALLKRK